MPYDEAPSRRMAWDADGTVFAWGDYDESASITEASAGNRATVNSEADTVLDLGGFITPEKYMYLLFPELRELDGIFYAYGERGQPVEMDSSPDSTNGIDGAWTTRVANLDDYNTVYASFRDNITSLTVSSQKATRVHIGSPAPGTRQECAAYHMYGRISPGETPDRIVILDTENSDAEFTKVLDFGDVSRGQTTTRTFKIKNNSSSKTINTIAVTAEDLYLNAGDWYTFGDDGVAYQATYAVGNLGPGSTKLIYLKQIIPDAETLGLQTGRISVSHDSVT